MYMITYTFSSFLKGENFGSFEWNKMKKAELNFKKSSPKGTRVSKIKHNDVRDRRKNKQLLRTEADRALKPHSVILSMEKVLISAI